MIQSEINTDTLQSVFDWIGSIFSMFYFSTPFIDVIILYKNLIKKEQISLIFLLIIETNTLIYFTYWLSLKDKNRISVVITNGYGFILNIISLLLYLYKYFERRFTHFLGFVTFVFILLGVEFILAFKIAKTTEVLRIIGYIIGFLMYSSPFMNLYHLFKTGDFSFVPFYTNIVGIFCCISWMLFGAAVAVNDKVKEGIAGIVSNFIYLIDVIIQIVILIYYYIKKYKRQKEQIKKELIGEIDEETKGLNQGKIEEGIIS